MSWAIFWFAAGGMGPGRFGGGACASASAAPNSAAAKPAVSARPVKVRMSDITVLRWSAVGRFSGRSDPENTYIIACARRILSAAVDDAALGQVVGGHFDGDLVTGQNPDVVFAHLARYVGRDDMAGLEFDAKRRIGQGLDDLALELNGLFF